MTQCLSPAQIQLFTGPLAVQVSSTATGLKPVHSRCWAAELVDGDLLTFIALDAQTGVLRKALHESKQVAVNVVNPLTMHGILLKGELVSIEEPDQAARDAADKSVTQLIDALLSVGFPDLRAGLNHPGPARRVTVRVQRCFDQTPGANAERCLEPQ